MSESATILLIDSDRDVAHGAARRLRAAGYNVLVARHERESIRLARAHRPDTILLDPHMPRWRGRSILTWLRKHPATAGIPLVMFTSRPPTDTARQRLKHGARLSISKPYEAPILLATVRAALGHSTHSNSSVREQAAATEHVRRGLRIDRETDPVAARRSAHQRPAQRQPSLPGLPTRTDMRVDLKPSRTRITPG